MSEIKERYWQYVDEMIALAESDGTITIEEIEIIDCPTEICTEHEINRTTGQDIHRGDRL